MRSRPGFDACLPVHILTETQLQQAAQAAYDAHVAAGPECDCVPPQTFLTIAHWANTTALFGIQHTPPCLNAGDFTASWLAVIPPTEAAN